jgi:trigger factor
VLHVEAEWTEVAGDYAQVLAEFARAVRVPGFRAGRAPAAVVERRHAKAILDEVRDHAVPRLYRAAADQEKLDPVSVVGVQDVRMEKDRGVGFRAVVDIPPRVRLPKYRKMTIEANPVSVGADQVDAVIRRFRERMARFEAVTGRSAHSGDLLRVDFRGECEGRPVGDWSAGAAGLGAAKDFWAYLGEQELLPGLGAGLAGAAVGEQRRVDVSFPAGFRVTELAGRKAVYVVDVKEIREQILPEIDAELLKAVGAESLEAWRASIESELRRAATEAETRARKDRVATWLLEKTELDLPESLVEREARQAFYHIVRDLYRRGATQEQVTQRREEVAREARRVGEERVKVSFILKEIAREESVTVSDEELEARLKSAAESGGGTAEQLRRDLEERHGLDDFRAAALSDKTLDHLLDVIKIKE